MTRKIFAVSLLLMLTGIFAYAQGEAKTVKVKGYLTDNMCAGSPDEDKDFAEDAKEHSVSCAMMPHCVKSGFAVAAGRKLYKLDEAGNKLASKVFKTTKLGRGVMVEVEGTVEGTTLHATKLVEVAAK
ncbi:MAG TPA: hypothetical protein VM864_08055 [Pyrinomonadaceae bacterium]|nr:hypothetical protein [Pyrinomonadaceae bacterium]